MRDIHDIQTERTARLLVSDYGVDGAISRTQVSLDNAIRYKRNNQGFWEEVAIILARIKHNNSH